MGNVFFFTSKWSITGRLFLVCVTMMRFVENARGKCSLSGPMKKGCVWIIVNSNPFIKI